MKKGFLAFLSLFMFVIICFSQTKPLEPLNPAWADEDIRGVRFLMGLTPIENHSISSLKTHFDAFKYKNASWSDESVLGFGGKRVKLSMGLGYTTIYIDYLLFNDRIVHYKMAADVSSEDWSRHGETVIRAWRDSGGPAFLLKDSKLSYDKDFPEVWKDYYGEIAKQLGPIESLDIPKDLANDYKLLTDPFENSEISMVACSDGKPAIDALEDAKRVDLIENVLRCYNPGGRIYAAVSLLRMQRKGRKLNSVTKLAIDKVVNSGASVTTCWGDTGISGLRARDVVPEYVKSKDWYLLRK
jgi:hypothetical protein